MEYRQLGRSGLKVPELGFGTGTFGGSGEFFAAWGSTGVPEATKLVDICLEAGVNLFDSADVYSAGVSEEILGKAPAPIWVPDEPKSKLEPVATPNFEEVPVIGELLL